MAGDWMQIDLDLPEKPEVLRLCAETGLTREVVVGHLVMFWRWVERNANAGALPHATPEVVMSILGVPKTFVDTLAVVRWIKFSEAGATIPGWQKRFSKSAKTRLLTARRVAKHKQKRKSVTTALPKEEKRIINTPLPPLPESLSAIASVWESFVAHRREIRKSLTPRSAGAIIAKLERWGPSVATTALENSIAGGWQGVFEPDAPGGNGSHRRAPRGPELDPEKANANYHPGG